MKEISVVIPARESDIPLAQDLKDSIKDYVSDIIIYTRECKTIAQAKNEGFKLAKNDIVFFIDADVRLIGSIKDINLSEKYDQWVAYTHVCNVKDEFTDKCINMINSRNHFKMAAFPIGFYGITRDGFNKLGGFNEDITTGEEYDFTFRAAAARYNTCWIKNIKVVINRKIGIIRKESRLFME